MLNILPLNRKITLRRAFLNQQLQLLVGICIVATSLAVVMVFASDWLLQRWLNSATVAANTDFISADERTELKELISGITMAVNQAQPLLAKQNAALTDTKAILEPTPETIQLHAVALSYTENLLRITGTAETREDLVNYQQILSTIPGITNLKSPLSDLNQREAIPFTMTATYEAPSL